MLGSCLTPQPPKGSLSVQQQPEQRGQVKQAETEAQQRREKKKTEVESRVLQRDTPFLDRLGFGGGTGRRGSCACVRVPLWSFRKTNQKQTKKPKRKHRGATFERSRTDTVDNEKASEEQFINDKPVSSDAQQ